VSGPGGSASGGWGGSGDGGGAGGSSGVGGPGGASGFSGAAGASGFGGPGGASGCGDAGGEGGSDATDTGGSAGPSGAADFGAPGDSYYGGPGEFGGWGDGGSGGVGGWDGPGHAGSGPSDGHAEGGHAGDGPGGSAGSGQAGGSTGPDGLLVSEVDGPPPRGPRSTRVVVPSGFRSTLPDVPPHLAPPAARESVPADVVGSFQRLTGIDLGFVPLVRSPQVARAAAESGARAYTSGGTVHLPAEAGDLDSTETHALLGHELAHVAQQRALGSRASEVGTHGGELEALAQAAERAMRGEPGEFPGPNGVFGGLAGVVGASGSGQLSWSAQGGFSSQADPPPRPEPHRPEPAGEPVAQRAPLAGQSDDLWTSDGEVSEVAPALDPPYPDDADSVAAVSPAELDALVARVESLAAGVGRHGVTADDATVATIAGRVAGMLEGRFVELNDSHDLDRLAVRIYDRLRSQLRMELLVDRERGGLLSEFR